MPQIHLMPEGWSFRHIQVPPPIILVQAEMPRLQAPIDTSATIPSSNNCIKLYGSATQEL